MIAQRFAMATRRQVDAAGDHRDHHGDGENADFCDGEQHVLQVEAREEHARERIEKIPMATRRMRTMRAIDRSRRSRDRSEALK